MAGAMPCCTASTVPCTTPCKQRYLLRYYVHLLLRCCMRCKSDRGKAVMRATLPYQRASAALCFFFSLPFYRRWAHPPFFLKDFTCGGPLGAQAASTRALTAATGPLAAYEGAGAGAAVLGTASSLLLLPGAGAGALCSGLGGAAIGPSRNTCTGPNPSAALCNADATWPRGSQVSIS